ncbi:MAG TPA: TetR/AcrR family transcriptional regulator [Vicinamibacteria bacterium]|nr:TetR/AcrR family transcriptional regulator [Vicinamibacteria bacterium]
MSKGEETRAVILEHALSMASRIGLEGLSIGGLASETGMSKSGLFAHFDSKLNLQLDVLRSSVDRFIARVVVPALKKPRGAPRVRALFEGWLSWSNDPALPGGCFFIAAANELDDRPGPLRDRLVSYQRDWIETLSTAARIAVEEGHFRADLDTRQFAYEFYSILMAYHHFSRLMRDAEAERRARCALEQLLERSQP